MIRQELGGLTFGNLGDYPAMPKIPRYYRDICITEKIDGTNASVFIDSEGHIWAGSKNRWLQPGKQSDNFGFAGWVAANAATLRTDLGPGLHRGEWWGLGINRGYMLFERRFSLFNASLAGKPFTTPSLAVVPVLYEGPHSDDAITEVLHGTGGLSVEGSRAAPGYLCPEGIVIFHKASRHWYKVTLENDAEAKSCRT